MRSLIVAVVVVLGGLLASPAFSQGSPVFTTPDDAIAAYLDGIRTRDFGEILSATAFDRLYAHFDFAAYVDSLGGLTPRVPAPAGDPLLLEIDKTIFAAGIAHEVKMLSYFLLGRPDLTQDKLVAMTPAETAALERALDMRRLGNLELIKVGIPRPKVTNDPKNQKNAAQRAGFFGADEYSERIALISLEGQTYEMGFQLMRFGQSWTITAQWSGIGSTSAVGVPWPMTLAQFDELLR